MPQYVILAKGHYVNQEGSDQQRLAEPGEVIELSLEAAGPLLGWRLALYEPDTLPDMPVGEDAVDTRQVEATDSAVRLAAEYGIDLRDVTGTGVGGKVIKPDVEALLQAQEAVNGNT